MKIGLYLQDLNDEACNCSVFEDAMERVKKSDIDILVFPENCYAPFEHLIFDNDLFEDCEGDAPIITACLALSSDINKAVVYSSRDKFDTLFSIWANAGAVGEETQVKLYIKHTATNFSAFDFNDYKEGLCESLFEPIVFKGKKIGLTICYDCNHSMFSRMYGVQDIDILINSTGGNVVYDKWHKYNKVRAIENHCFNFVTMGYVGYNKVKNSYVYGYSPEGKELPFDNLTKKLNNRNEISTIYVYDTSASNGEMEEDFSLNQPPTENKNTHLYIPVGNVQSLIDKSKCVDENIYALRTRDEDYIIFCVVDGMDILKPEIVSKMLYNKALKNIKNKRYIIVNRHKNIDEKIYCCQLSDVLKVRSMENYCAVILESDKHNMCYQCGNNRTAQVVMLINGEYGIDLKRTTGPEAIWKNKKGMMKAAWRDGYEWIISKCSNLKQ